MKITEMTDQHLLNRIKFFERKLNEKPEHASYMGDSEYASDSVDQENKHNEWVAEQIEAHIKYMKSVAKQRKLDIK